MRRLLLATIALLSAMVFVGCDVTVGMRDDLYALYYTSADGEVVYPTPEGFDGHILSNTYEKGRGKITFDRPITRVGWNAFRYCTSLTSISIPDSVTSIGNGAFMGCTSLTSVAIPDGVTSIGSSAFAHCTSLTSATIGNGVISIGDRVFSYCSSLTSVTIGNGVTSIGEKAFHNCTSLTSIIIPDSVTEIGSYAFAGCTSLTRVYCKPTTPPSGGLSMFAGNASGRKIYVPEESVETYKTAEYWSEYADAIVGHDFYNDDEDNTNNIPDNEIWYTSTDGNVVTPHRSGTSYFGANIISNTYADGQGVITFDGNVTSIGTSAFRGCSSLASVTIPDSVTSIGYYAFMDCTSLTSVTIPDSVTSIGYYAFQNCTSLTSITIPDSVTSIGYFAFRSCTSLTSVYCKPTTPPSGDSSMFYDNASGRKIYVPTESVEAYKSADYWSAYADAIVGYSF